MFHGLRNPPMHSAKLLRIAVLALFSCPGITYGEGWKFVGQRGVFVIHSDFSLEPYEWLIDELDKLRTELASILQLPMAQERIDIYLFTEKPTYESYMRHYFPGTVARRAMFIKSNSPGNVFAFKSDQFAVDLRHETTHAVLNSMLPTVPLWLDEGLAEYFEIPAEQRANQHEHLKAMKKLTFWFRPTALQKLEPLTKLDQMGPSEYRDAWAWIHFLLHGPPEISNKFNVYLGDLARHKSSRALSERLGEAVENPDKMFVDHFRRWGP
jgi:hypothetical protein